MPEKLATAWSSWTTVPRTNTMLPVSRTISHTASSGMSGLPPPTNWVDSSTVTDGPALPLPMLCMVVNSEMSISESVTAPWMMPCRFW